MDMQLTIKKITLVRQKNQTDTAFLLTELPGAVWPYMRPTSLRLDIAHSTGEDYLRENFPGVEVEVVDVDKTKPERVNQL